MKYWRSRALRQGQKEFEDDTTVGLQEWHDDGEVSSKEESGGEERFEQTIDEEGVVDSEFDKDMMNYKDTEKTPKAMRITTGIYKNSFDP